MTDTDKLKRLAEAKCRAESAKHFGHEYVGFDPDTILALITENEALTTGSVIEVAVRNPSVADYVQHWEGRTERAERERDEAVALLREWCSVGNPMERGHCHNKTDAFLARMDTVASQPAAASTLGNEGQQQEVG